MDPFQELGSCDTRRQTEHRHRGILCVKILPTSTQSKGIFTWGYVRLQRENTSAVVTVGCFLPTNTNLWVFENSHWKGVFSWKGNRSNLGWSKKKKKEALQATRVHLFAQEYCCFHITWYRVWTKETWSKCVWNVLEGFLSNVCKMQSYLWQADHP